ncbi:hypothetical protein TSUD_25060 [Trifolium subterraneum]|uniref:Uncharacterized protein n=1 Tax=Trifolium subterraneum TaxID=3900 RepID=A0A2Z6NUN6_TRISU|nr:hypothetical protein TSUD_25060 [Trifolium subterraneum]
MKINLWFFDSVSVLLLLSRFGSDSIWLWVSVRDPLHNGYFGELKTVPNAPYPIHNGNIGDLRTVPKAPNPIHNGDFGKLKSIPNAPNPIHNGYISFDGIKSKPSVEELKIVPSAPSPIY